MQHACVLVVLYYGICIILFVAVGNIVFGRYCYTDDLLSLEAAVPYEVNLPDECLHIVSPLNPDVWSLLLTKHPDRQFVNYLIRGLRGGFHVGCHASAQDLQSALTNMPCAIRHPEVIDKYLQDELECNRLVEVTPSESSVVHISRFGVIPKKHQPGRWRLIVDLSSPLERSVNDYIDPSLCSLSYASVEDAAAFVLKAGRGALLAKLDIKSAYRNIPIHPGDRHLLGMKWQDRVFIDTCLPFGLRSAPKIFNATADALEWIIANGGETVVEFIVHYLDDFLFGGSPNSDSCRRSLHLALCICNLLGFPVMTEKVFGPSAILEFLGFVIDTLAMEIRLPEEKLQHLKSLLRAWASRKSCTKRELLSLIGSLQHASAVVKPGRVFLRRMIDLSKRQMHLDATMRLNTEFRADLRWWATFIELWNGVSIISALCRRPIDDWLTSDASGSWGCGAYFRRCWFNISWQACPSWTDMHIAVKELLPIVISCALWGQQMRNCHVCCRCDNAAVVSMINRHTSRHPVAMHLLRCLFFICAKYTISLTAEHLPGHVNRAADALSRGNVPAFFRAVPYAEASSCSIPSNLLDVLIHRRPNWLSAEWSEAFQACL